MTPQQVLDKIKLLENVTESQRTQLEDFRRNKPVAQVQQAPTEEVKKVSAAEFWQDPATHIGALVDEKLNQQLDRVISPFREDLARSQQDQAWKEIREKYSDFHIYEPYVRRIVEQGNIQNPNVQLLEQLYYTAFGYAAKQNNAGVTEPTAPKTPDSQRPLSPQHRASNQPIRQETTKKKIELTENDRYMMKQFGMTNEEEYIAYRDAQEDEVMSVSSQSGEKK